jgi:catechol 2,3-dioxygenase-like lactoylglutathione lyase family enzyme
LPAEPGDGAIVAVHHTTMFVTDLERSVRFYRDVLGFELASRDDERRGPFLDAISLMPDVHIKIALITFARHTVELIQPVAPPGQATDAGTALGMSRMGFEVRDIDALVARLERDGLEFMSEVVTVTEGHYSGGKAVFFRDPDGVILEFQEPTEPGRVT